MNEPLDTAEVHWLFKPTEGGFARLAIQVFSDGDYWVHDSPTGTYAAGHGDRGKWRSVYEQYIAAGYVSETVAKATGLVPPSWTHELPEVPWARQRRRSRLLALSVLLLLLAASGILGWIAQAS